MKRVLAVAWVDLLAILPFVLLVLFAKDPLEAFGRIDPFIVLRLFVLIWVISHVILLLQRFAADLSSMRDYLVDLEGRWPGVGAAAIAASVMKWTTWRVVGLSIRHGWATVLIIGVVVAVNLATMLVLSGRL